MWFYYTADGRASYYIYLLRKWNLINLLMSWRRSAIGNYVTVWVAGIQGLELFVESQGFEEMRQLVEVHPSIKQWMRWTICELFTLMNLKVMVFLKFDYFIYILHDNFAYLSCNLLYCNDFSMWDYYYHG